MRWELWTKRSIGVIRAAKQPDEVLEVWRDWPLGTVIFLYLDARYEKAWQAVCVHDAAILIASGFKKDGNRSI